MGKENEINSSKKFQKPTLRQNVRIKIPDIDRAKMDLRSIIAIVTELKTKNFMNLLLGWVN